MRRRWHRTCRLGKQDESPEPYFLKTKASPVNHDRPPSPDATSALKIDAASGIPGRGKGECDETTYGGLVITNNEFDETTGYEFF
jgi:hypothetical protein